MKVLITPHDDQDIEEGFLVLRLKTGEIETMGIDRWDRERCRALLEELLYRWSEVEEVGNSGGEP